MNFKIYKLNLKNIMLGHIKQNPDDKAIYLLFTSNPLKYKSKDKFNIKE